MHIESLPTRGAWIEMRAIDRYKKDKQGRSLRGERGLKYCAREFYYEEEGRSLRGERGLKFRS